MELITNPPPPTDTFTTSCVDPQVPVILYMYSYTVLVDKLATVVAFGGICVIVWFGSLVRAIQVPVPFAGILPVRVVDVVHIG